MGPAAPASIVPFREALVPALVDAWNLAFRDRRNFVRMTPELFRERISGKSNAVEAFDPAGFLVAFGPDGAVAVFAHAGVRTERVCRAVYGPDWPGGSEGYIAMIHVDPASRRRGFGAALWEAGLRYLRGCGRIVLDGQCLNPFYGNSEGPQTPLWGTSEGPAVEEGDQAAQGFLERRGYRPAHRAVSMELELAIPIRAGAAAARERLDGQGLEASFFASCQPVLGGPPEQGLPFPCAAPFACLVVATRPGEGAASRVLGVLNAYPMRGVDGRADDERWAISDFRVADEARGRGLGRAVLDLFLEALARGQVPGFGPARGMELVCVPELSPAAHALYLSAGFREEQGWWIYGTRGEAPPDLS